MFVNEYFKDLFSQGCFSYNEIKVECALIQGINSINSLTKKNKQTKQCNSEVTKTQKLIFTVSLKRRLVSMILERGSDNPTFRVIFVKGL